MSDHRKTMLTFLLNLHLMHEEAADLGLWDTYDLLIHAFRRAGAEIAVELTADPKKPNHAKKGGPRGK